MTSEEILYALEIGKISLEDAKKALTTAANSTSSNIMAQDLADVGTGDRKGEWGLPPSGGEASPLSTLRDFDASSASPYRSVDVWTGANPVPTAPTRPLWSPVPGPTPPVSNPASPATPLSSEAIAIVGMSGRYPDARNLAEYWNNLVQGKNAIREIPLSRFDVSDYYDPNPAQKGKIYCKELGVVDEIEYFDPLFFHLSPAEAEVMDPQQRLFLEEGYKAFEDAGYSPGLLGNSKCGVYLGGASQEYGQLLSEHNVAEADLLGTSTAIAAARIAYLLNLKGPAIAIDTACSSSLVATHLACQALRHQEIDMALVGGASLCLTPGFYVRMCNAGMLSPDGQCKTFDASANGFVPGDGVGALVLKRLADAEADHDQIYGVIIGSGMNQDGKTNGITAPSVRSQSDLVREIYEKYKIDPTSISYVEMHGTGTKLGDPIELEALATVFQEKTQRKQYCAIGSVKTNIGHTLAAAGVAGLQKVLLAMKQKKLVPSLHFQQPNPQFDFAASPFYVNTHVQDWQAAAGAPRRAAVSSFGFSGTNAHLVVEEYLPAHRNTDGGKPRPYSPRPTETPGLFVLSAKSEEQLKRYSQDLKMWIQGHQEQDLQDMAFTLQLGREAMDYRLVIVADSREILLQRLGEFVDNRVSTGLYTAQVKRGLGIDATLFEADTDGQSLLHIWCQKKNLAKIAQVWVKGVTVDWVLLYTGSELRTAAAHSYPPALPYRVSLPTYPFARQLYWIPTPTVGNGGSLVPNRNTVLHPLVQHNTSDFFEQRFSSTFNGEEFFLADHVIKGQRIMPGVAYLEMARAAVAQAMRSTGQEEGRILCLNRVVWPRPLVVGDLPITIQITLELQENGTISFLISGERQGEETIGRAQAPSLYCQGTAELRTQSTIQSLDLPAIQTRCQHRISATKCYQRYRELGFSYGPALLGIEELSVGEGEVLARLRLPVAPEVAQTQPDFVLHPSVMDAALQASIGLLIEQNEHQDLHMPFALEDLEILGEVPAQSWAWVRRSPGSTTGQVFDIELCDDTGRIAVRLHCLSSRQLLAEEEARTILLTPGWKEEVITISRLSGEGIGLAPAHSLSLILLCDLPDAFASRIQAQMASGRYCRSLSVETSSVPTAPTQQSRREQRFQDAVVQLIQEIQQLLQSRPDGQALVQVVVARREEPSFLEALVGVLNTAQQEYPKLRGQLIEVEDNVEEERLLTWLRENQHGVHETHIRYRDGKRWVREWQEVVPVTAPTSIPWKESGCYLISGGAGGLARLLVEEIARQVQKATIVLVGRSALSQEQRARLEPTENSGIRIDYQQVDISDGPAVHALIQRVLTHYGHLNGIIHAAGVLRDTLVLNKTPEEAQAVLAPKVIGVELLDEASSQIPLDFFILYSSATAVMGYVGQADYASANAYLDAFAHARRAQVMAGERQGETVSINWPLWQEGGMRVEASKRQMMQKRLGIEAIGTEMGMKTLYQVLACEQAQIIVLHGQMERIKQHFLQRSAPPVESTLVERTSDPESEMRQDKLRAALTHMISRILKVRAEEVDAETPLPEYGFDSIAFTELANHLNQTYQLDLTPTLFYEHSTLEQLTQYLHANHVTTPIGASSNVQAGSTIEASSMAMGSPGSEPMMTNEMSPTIPMPRRLFRSAHLPMQVSGQKEPAGAEPIAIIGMSGMFPQAPDLQSFWSNLLAGRDCISEIPSSRWDWRTYFGDPATQANKTNVKWAGVMEGVETFDPLFFGITPREAVQMDPQQRLLMMYVWKAIEDAGYAASSLSGTNTALFIGTMSSSYGERLCRAGVTIEGYSSTGQAASVGPNRMSYFMNLHGPSEPVETACSSSLVAIHKGVNAIESGQCSMAIVGGVNILVSPETHISFSRAGMLCEDGRCKTFSAQANGYARGEGVGMLVLKKLSEAEKAGDHIYAVIRGSAENHGGRASSLTAPNPRAQANLLIATYRKAGIDPRTVGYIEAHGTGTQLGDPIEINGLKTAFQELVLVVPRTAPRDEAPKVIASHAPYSVDLCTEESIPQAGCGIGSIKSNIGHLELAAGVAGVIKVLLQMQHKKLVKSLHCEQINPYIQLEGSPFYIVQENREWEALRDPAGNLLPRRAGVSSFGFGGVNAHVVLEEYVPKPRVKLSESSAQRSPLGQTPRMIVLSAKNEERLHEQVRQLLAWVAVGTAQTCGARHDPYSACSTHTEEPLDLQDLAYTLQVGREAMEERLALQVSSLAELEEKLRRYLQEPQEGGDWYRGRVRQHDAISLFTADEDGQKAVVAWMSKGKYEKLLEFWVKGLTMDWKHLYGEHLPHRISLPTYPFAQERYWISAPKAEPISNYTAKATSPVDTNRVALRPLADQLPPSINLPRSSAPFSQSGSNDVVVPVRMPVAQSTGSAQGTGLERGAESAQSTIPTTVPELEKELVRSLAQTLYMEPHAIDVEKPFVAIGLDSVVGMEWIQSLNKQYASNLKASSVYDHPTIRQLAAYLGTVLLKDQPTLAQSISTPQLHAVPEEQLQERETSAGQAMQGTEGEARAEVEQRTEGEASSPLRHDVSIGTMPYCSGELASPVRPAPIEALKFGPMGSAPASALRRNEAIAIVGMSGKYPDARNLSEYWDNLVQGKNAVREIPPSRFDVSDYYDPSPSASGKMYCKWLGALDEIEYFDSLFFHISPAEAEIMDPQQRLFLEEGYKAFEDAGYSPELLSNRKCGVYLGITGDAYAVLLSEQKATETNIFGTSPAIAAARIAYLLNLKGPAIAIDTACSSSLVATHLACQALRSQEIDMALVGGVSLYLTPSSYIGMCSAGMLSPDGQCKTFDASANGFVPGEGVGSLVLKRLADAEADHDQIYGVIIASGMNQDGATNGIAAPSVKSQVDLVREIYEKYQIDPASISYVEMHGTGTKLGDPIELEALATVFQEKTQHKQYCAIGSVKTNIGHTSVAAGMAGLQKVLLTMKQKKLVPTLHFKKPNDHFDFISSPFYVNTEVQNWQPVVGIPRRAAVSSFSFSGTNAHLVVEEYIPARRDADGDEPRPTETPGLFVLSARSEEQLKSYAQELRIWIQGHKEQYLRDIAFTLQLGREAMDYRLAIIADSREVLLQRLEEFVDNRVSTGLYTAQVKKSLEVGQAPARSSARDQPFSDPSSGIDITLFESDVDGQALLRIWCQKKNLERIAQVWVRGVNVDWKLLYGLAQGTGSAVACGRGQAPTLQAPQVCTTPTEIGQASRNRERSLSGPQPLPLVTALPHRVSLPTYPFARQRYWLPVGTVETVPNGSGLSLPTAVRSPLSTSTDETVRTASGAWPMALHPLVHRNTSTLWEQRFSSTFYGDEFFLTDHVIKGERIMPGVAYLEMARVAVMQTIGATAAQESGCLRLNHVVWTRPLVCNPEHPVTVHITLSPQENGTIEFVISHDAASAGQTCGGQTSLLFGDEPEHLGTVPMTPQEEKTTGRGQALSLHCQGTALVWQTPKLQSTIESLDLSTVQARCRHQISASECYQRYRELGISYGPAMQGIEELRVGEGEVLARLCLPVVLEEGIRRDRDKPCLHPYVLHPSMLDAALQASIGLLIKQDEHQELQIRSSATGVPFAFEELEILGEVPAQCWAWVRQRPVGTVPCADPATGQTPHLLDIELCDDTGRVAVRMRGLSSRQLPSEEEIQTVLLRPQWKEEAIVGQEQAQPLRLVSSLILLCDLPSIEASHLQTRLVERGRCQSLHSSRSRRGERFQDMVVQLIQEIQQFLQSRPAAPVASNPQVPILIQVVVTHREEPSFLEALAGVLKTTQQEYPKLRGQLIEVEGEVKEEQLLTWLRENQQELHEAHIRYRDGKRWVREWREVEDGGRDRAARRSGSYVTAPISIPWKEGGCYLISGGTGGLARLLVQEIVRRVQEVTIVLVGRSALSQKQHTAVACGLAPQGELVPQGENSSIHIDYQQVDISDGPAVHALIQRVLAQYGHLNGIIHAAGVLRDSLLLSKTPEEVRAVLAPKALGIEHLDEASRQLPLDFFILCSSLAAVAGNVGQADYAAANAYLDAFAYARQTLVQAGERHGETVSINWPFWEEGGMQIEASNRQVMREQLGIEAMGTEIGMRMLYQALACGQAQVMVVHGQVERIKQWLLQKPEPTVGAAACPCPQPPHAPLESMASPTDKARLDTLRETLKRMVSELLKLPVEQVDAKKELSKYGFDSIFFTALVRLINRTYQLDLTPALFFEHSTLESLTQYLHATYDFVPVGASPIIGTSPAIGASPMATGDSPTVETTDEAPAGSSITGRRLRIAHEAVQGNRILFLKVHSGSQED